MAVEVRDAKGTLRATIGADGTVSVRGTLLGFINPDGSAGDSAENFLGEISANGAVTNAQDKAMAYVDTVNRKLLATAGGSVLVSLQAAGELVTPRYAVLARFKPLPSLPVLAAYLVHFDPLYDNTQRSRVQEALTATPSPSINAVATVSGVASLRFVSTSRGLLASIKSDTLVSSTDVVMGYLNADGTAGDSNENFVGEVSMKGEIIDAREQRVGHFATESGIITSGRHVVATLKKLENANNVLTVLDTEGKILLEAQGEDSAASKRMTVAFMFFFSPDILREAEDTRTRRERSASAFSAERNDKDTIEKRRLEEERQKLELERLKQEEAKRQLEAEKQKLEAERLRLEAERQREEAERKRLLEEEKQRVIEEERKRLEEQRMKLEEERRQHEERLRLDQERQQREKEEMEKQQSEERRQQEELERLKREEELRQKEEAERKHREESDLKQREAERIQKEQEDLERRKELELKQEEERQRRIEEERLRLLEEEEAAEVELARMRQLQREREEALRQQEESDRLAALEAERLLAEEAEDEIEAEKRNALEVEAQKLRAAREAAEEEARLLREELERRKAEAEMFDEEGFEEDEYYDEEEEAVATSEGNVEGAGELLDPFDETLDAELYGPTVVATSSGESSSNVVSSGTLVNGLAALAAVHAAASPLPAGISEPPQSQDEATDDRDPENTPNQDTADSTVSPPSSSPQKPLLPADGRQIAVALYDYKHPYPEAKEFFNFGANDKFIILPSGKELQGWKIAVRLDGSKGFVPGNYLRYYDINAPDLPPDVLDHAVASGYRSKEVPPASPTAPSANTSQNTGYSSSSPFSGSATEGTNGEVRRLDSRLVASPSDGGMLRTDDPLPVATSALSGRPLADRSSSTPANSTPNNSATTPKENNRGSEKGPDRKKSIFGIFKKDKKPKK